MTRPDRIQKLSAASKKVRREENRGNGTSRQIFSQWRKRKDVSFNREELES
jgi:hypothetical protein